MVRGLDGFFDTRVALCGFEGHREGVRSHRFPVVMARGKHLFPFRTEQLSPSAPMVLGPQGPGRVGRRRLFVGTGRLRAARSAFWGRTAGGARLAPVLTPRLELRPIAEGDVDALAALDALPEIRAAIDPFGEFVPEDPGGLLVYERRLVRHPGRPAAL